MREIFESENYIYRYNQCFVFMDGANKGGKWINNPEQNGWGVRVKDETLSEYEPILEEIDGKPVTSLISTFRNCINLIETPNIPKHTKYLSYTFMGCKNLITVSEIPYGVVDMYCAFRDCISLMISPTIPETTNDIDSAFRNCSSLIVVSAIPKWITDMNYTFAGCTSLFGIVAIDCSPIGLKNCFKDCAQSEARTIYLIGESSKLKEFKRTAWNDGQYVSVREK